MKKTMMKALVIALITLSSFIAPAQPSGYMGCNDWPAELYMVTRYDDYQPGDIIYSTYSYSENYYASHVHDIGFISNLDAGEKINFFIKAWADDGLNPVKCGLSKGEHATYFVYRNNQFYALSLEVSGDFNSAFKAAALHITSQVETVHDNLYYSLCPAWTDVVETQAYKQVRMYYFNNFYSFMRLNDILPKYVDHVAFELVTGTGTLRAPRAGTMDLPKYYAYRFSREDIQRGYITLKIKVVPFKNCDSAVTEQNITIKLKK